MRKFESKRQFNFTKDDMNKKTKILLILAISSFNSWAISRDEILNKVISNLNQIKTVEYTSDFHLYNKSQNINIRDTATCYFDFTSSDSIIGAKYMFFAHMANCVFNGNFLYDSEFATKQLIYNYQPSNYSVTSSIFMNNSIFVIRKILPEFVSDSTTTITRLNDTILDNTACYKFKIILKDKFINLGGVLTHAKGVITNHILSISKDNYLPKEYSSFSPNNTDYIQATISNIIIPAFKPDSLWNYDWMPEEYLRISYEDFIKSINTSITQQIGKQAPDWTLPMIKGDSVKLSAQKNNLILLNFWFVGCGACLQDVPDINEIQKEFAGKGLKVYGIEFVKPNDKGLTEYIDKNKIEYSILYKGNKTASDYAVTAAPMFFLINNQQKIIYASTGLRKIDLLKAIKENIK